MAKPIHIRKHPHNCGAAPKSGHEVTACRTPRACSARVLRAHSGHTRDPAHTRDTATSPLYTVHNTIFHLARSISTLHTGSRSKRPLQSCLVRLEHSTPSRLRPTYSSHHAVVQRSPLASSSAFSAE